MVYTLRRNCWIKGNGHLQLWIYCRIAPQSSCANLHSHQRRWGVPGAPQACRHLILLVLMFCQSDGCEMVSRWFKMFTFLFTNEVGHLFVCLWGWVVFNPGTLGQFSRAWESGWQCWFCQKIGKGRMRGGKLGRPKNKSGTVEKEWKLEFERMITRRWKGVAKRLQTRSEKIHLLNVESKFGIHYCAGQVSPLQLHCSCFVELELALVNIVSGASSVESTHKTGLQEFSCLPSCFLKFF